MKASAVLEMLNKGQIEELKTLLEDEIYTESLKHSPDSKKRYTAMKKYFGYIKTAREILQKPCPIDFEGKNYISFCNSHSLVLTTESCGEMKTVEDTSRYPDVTRLVHFDGDERKIDFARVFAEAKSKGYRLVKSELGPKYKYLMKYDGAYFKLGLIDISYSIINDGNEALVYHANGKISPITIKNDIGICTVMPVALKDVDLTDFEFVVIEVN